MIPFSVFELHLGSLDYLSFDRLLEDYSHFSTLPKAPLDSSGHLAFVYGYFFPDKGLQVSLLVEKVLYNDGIVVGYAIH